MHRCSSQAQRVQHGMQQVCLALRLPQRAAESVGLEVLAQTPGCDMVGSIEPEGVSEIAVRG